MILQEYEMALMKLDLRAQESLLQGARSELMSRIPDSPQLQRIESDLVAVRQKIEENWRSDAAVDGMLGGWQPPADLSVHYGMKDQDIKISESKIGM